MSAPRLAGDAVGRPRTPLHVDVRAGRIETAGQRARFDPAAPDAALVAYLRLVRRLRDVEREPSLVLRRDEVVVLAGALRLDAAVVLDRLGALMGATVPERRSMVTAFLAGALLIAVASGATALAPSEGRGPTATTSGQRSEVVATGPLADGAEDGPGTDAVPADTPTAAAVPDAETGPTPDTARDAVDDDATPVATPVIVGEDAPVADGAEDPAPTSQTLPPRGSQRPDRLWSGPEVVQPGATIDIPPDGDATGADGGPDVDAVDPAPPVDVHRPVEPRLEDPVDVRLPDEPPVDLPAEGPAAGEPTSREPTSPEPGGPGHPG